MKTIVFLATLFIMLSVCTGAFADESDTLLIENVPLKLKKTLALKFQFPDEATELKIEGNVTTCFYIKTNGKIVIKCINGHPVLTKYVRKRLESLNEDFDVAWLNKPMIVRFKFESELF